MKSLMRREDLWGGKSEYTWIILKISATREQSNKGSNLRKLLTQLDRSALYIILCYLEPQRRILCQPTREGKEEQLLRM